MAVRATTLLLLALCISAALACTCEPMNYFDEYCRDNNAVAIVAVKILTRPSSQRPKRESVQNDPAKLQEDPSRPEEDPTELEEDPSKPQEDPTNPEEDPTELDEDPTTQEEDPTELEEDPTELDEDPTELDEDLTTPSPSKPYPSATSRTPVMTTHRTASSTADMWGRPVYVLAEVTHVFRQGRSLGCYLFMNCTPHSPLPLLVQYT